MEIIIEERIMVNRNPQPWRLNVLSLNLLHLTSPICYSRFWHRNNTVGRRKRSLACCTLWASMVIYY